MAAHFPGRARACFDLKRSTYPLVSMVLRTTDLAEVERELRVRLGEAPDFFDQALLVLNLAPVQADQGRLELAALVALLREFGFRPVGVHGGSAAQMAAAERAGLVPTPEVTVADSMARSVRAAAGAPGAVAPLAAVPSNEASASAAAPGDAAAAAPAAGAVAPAPTLVIDRPLRSGQRVYARGADLVLLDVVSNGAEVIADGNVHVYAPLRGRAIAGASGNEAARIFTTCLDPQLVAIAGVYRTTETPLAPEVAGRPAQVRRVADSLLIEPLEFPALNTKDKL